MSAYVRVCVCNNNNNNNNNKNNNNKINLLFCWQIKKVSLNGHLKLS